ncbi:FtsX-like permease family protein [Modestobacter sp. SSW1-42]|uniref:FtsX-like permease family protein n=1 Tax=Modestobacter sp. SSW1-42 TaxID=596372 RepID=UPI0039889E41
MSRPPLWRLAPWTRAPLLGLRQPAAVLAVLVTSAILACAVASAPLFLSSARSGALQQQLAPQCAEAGWGQTGAFVLQFDQNGRPTGQRFDGPALDGALERGWRETGHESVPVMATGAIGTTDTGPVAGLVRDAAGAALAVPGTVFYRPGAVDDVERVDPGGGDGVWVPRSWADQAGIAAGDTITVADSPVPVAGRYTDLFATTPSSVFCDYRQLYANDTSANTPPPALLLATDPTTFARLATGFGGVSTLRQVHTDPAALSVSDARALLTDQASAQAAAAVGARVQGPLPGTRLADAADRAGLIERGLRGPVVPVAVAGGLLALVLVAAAGSFWADRRATEVRLLAARGVGPLPLAGKAALELELPALAGAALGWAASRALVAGLGPADDLDPSASTAAVRAGVGAFVVGLGAAALVAGLRARSTAERPMGAAPRWPARVPWELALLGAAGWCWALLQDRDAVVSEANVAQVNGLLVAFPLLAIAGAAVLLGRLVTALLPRLRRWARRRPPAVFLAVNRLGAARLATGTLLVAVTLPVAVLGYTATLTASAQTTLDAKVGVQIGAARAVVAVARFAPTPAVDAVGTFVVRYDGSAEVPDRRGGAPDRGDVQVLAVDPDDLAGTAFWDDSFADSSLPALMAALDGPEVDGRLPVVATDLALGDADLRVGSTPVGAEVVDVARVLPGRRSNAPLVLVAADRLPEIPRSAGAARVGEVWTNGPIEPALDAVLDAGATATRLIEPGQVQQRANFLGITWTFGYLSALAVFVGVIAVGGLLLYLEARSRTRVSGYVMARRLGLTRAAHLRSLLVELAGVAVVGSVLGGVLAAGAVALVYRRLDVDRLRPPTPLLDVPWPALAGSVVVVLVVAGLAALYAQRAADRADPASVLREDA